MTKQTGRKVIKHDASPTLVEEDRDAKEGHVAKKLKSSDTDTRNAENILPEEYKLLHKYWMASNYLAVGQVNVSWYELSNKIVHVYHRNSVSFVATTFGNHKRMIRSIFLIRILCSNALSSYLM